MGSSVVTNVPLLNRMLIGGEAEHVWGEGVLYGKSLSLNFAVNPNKVALKSLFKKGGDTREYLESSGLLHFRLRGKG